MGEPLSPLATPSATRRVLEAHGLATKKALGQNFLVNDDVLRKIIDLGAVGPEDVVLEVGPGIGTLTIALLKHAAQVISVERDADLPVVLAETCAPWSSKFSLVSKDAVALVEEDVRGACDACGLRGALPNKFVANLPYAVAATLVLDYFQKFDWLESATVMVQKEVADRMMAHPGTKDYGAFTVKLALYAQPVGRFAVGPRNFFPPPRVDSAVIRLDRAVPVAEDGAPISPVVVRAAALMADAAFANRRKTLANSCKTYFAGRGGAGASVAAALLQLFEAACVNPSVRGETLQVADFVRVGKALSEVAPQIL